jgi:GLPGLI family protein
MKFLVFLIFCVNICFAQNITGTAYYKKELKSQKFDVNSNKDIHNMISKASESLIFELFFDKSVAIFLQQKKIYHDKKSKLISKLGAFGASGIVYTDIDNSSLIYQKNLGGETFLINYPFPYFKWELINETNKIGKFLCYKALHTEDYIDKNGREGKKIVTAWYTPEIPTSFGPHIYGGLPGLIVELDNGMQVFRLTKIKFTNEKNGKLKKPIKGLKVNKNEYDKIVKEMLNERLGRN